VVLIGGNAAKIYHAFLIISGLICHYIFIAQLKHPIANIGLIPGLVLIIHLRKVMQTRDPKEFDPELKKVALATFGIAVLTAIGLMIG
jgi:1,4-dihydroxy-2-naphthoate octaprenyltransferase